MIQALLFQSGLWRFWRCYRILGCPGRMRGEWSRDCAPRPAHSILGNHSPPCLHLLVCDTAKRESFWWTFIFAGKFRRAEITEQRNPPGLWRRRKRGIVQCRGQGLEQWDRAKFKTSYLGDYPSLRVILGFPTFSWQILGVFLSTGKREKTSIAPGLSLQLT